MGIRKITRGGISHRMERETGFQRHTRHRLESTTREYNQEILNNGEFAMSKELSYDDNVKQRSQGDNFEIVKWEGGEMVSGKISPNGFEYEKALKAGETFSQLSESLFKTMEKIKELKQQGAAEEKIAAAEEYLDRLQKFIILAETRMAEKDK